MTPRSFRHATAVHLVSAGVDVTVIRSRLDHVSLDTTNHYARANRETKQKALEQVGAPRQNGQPSSVVEKGCEPARLARHPLK